MKKVGQPPRRSRLDEREVLHAIELCEVGHDPCGSRGEVERGRSTVRRALHDQGGIPTPARHKVDFSRSVKRSAPRPSERVRHSTQIDVRR
jgi:hypothetical protein